ncbi:hypothetical protein ACTVZO_41070 [Streptomyces sp. IBSNAI002]|uniref:hypothetical protein n=1 Tax=Streptomyces sp. IBSNAI002 TaxID=3457500 RepID=UPI003FCF1B62
MSDGQAMQSGGGDKKKADQKDAGAFGAVRRRRPPAPQANLAATLLQQAEEVADASFMGNVTALASPIAVVTDLSPASLVTPPPIAPSPVATDQTPTPLREGDVPAQQAVVVSAAQPVARTVLAPAEPSRNRVADDPPKPESVVSMPEQNATPEPELTSPAPAQKPRKASRAANQLGPTHAAIHSTFADSRTNSRDWSSHGANMIPEVWDALRSRIASDRRSSGNPELAAGHYMDVVYREAPMDAQELVVLYKRLSDQRLGYLGSGKKSTFRLGPEAKANASEIKALLDEADYSRKGLYVVSALVIVHLQKLEAEGPLRKPELPPLF